MTVWQYITYISEYLEIYTVNLITEDILYNTNIVVPNFLQMLLYKKYLEVNNIS